MHPVDRAVTEWRAERPELDPSPIATFGRLRRTSEHARRLMRSYLKPFGLTLNTFDVLANLRRGGAPHRKTPSELADSTLLSSGAITGPLDALEADGLIERVPHPQDRRIKYAQLTALGLERIDAAIEVHLATEAQVLASVAPDHREALVEALTAFEQALRSTLEHEDGGTANRDK